MRLVLESGQLAPTLRYALFFQLFLALNLAQMRLRIMQDLVIFALPNLVTALIPALLVVIELQLLVIITVCFSVIIADFRGSALHLRSIV